MSIDAAAHTAANRLGELGVDGMGTMDAAMAIVLAFALLMLFIAPLACSQRR